ncbi:hypothetical protein C1H46_042491 [Malus baccata]|uniref:Uncharacterized protein n=1 Tax=Malus baccata TaxID=106549 RepID=A0A540KCK9_MALBA|nr:hypothetical protein C1H46_042491 [Malus baccata]
MSAMDQLYGDWTTKVQQSVIMNEVCKKGHMVHRKGKDKSGKQPNTQLGHNSQGSKSKKKGKKNVDKKSQSQQEVMGNQSLRVPGIGSLDYTSRSLPTICTRERVEELNMTIAKA